jgi:PAS domain S-box-containing protein
LDQEFLKSITVLYVEDEADIRDSMSMVFEKLFKKTVMATNGQDGYDKFRLHYENNLQFDIVISDINMPDMNGLDMIEKIREIDKDVPVVLTTAHSDSEYFIEAINHNVFHYAIKPIKVKELALAIQDATKKYLSTKVITAKQAENERYLDIIEQVALVSKTDLSANITFVNDIYCEASGYMRNELIGANQRVVRHEDMPTVFFDTLWDSLRAKTVWKGKIKNKAKENYQLDLRISAIPVQDIHKANQKILITKIQISNDYAQATIKGGGLEYADKVLKVNDEKYSIKEKIDENFSADFDGLECRWEAIPSPKDETLSILIKCIDENYYEDVLNHLDTILGKNNSRHPIVKESLNLSQNSSDLSSEASAYTNNTILKNLYILKYKSINILGKILMQLNISGWGKYKNNLIASCDTEKFDDMIKMVVSSNYKQTKQLENYLYNEFSNNNLYYGIHKADAALMTCLVFQRDGKHIHFVDSANGGYAMAAKQMKKQIKDKENDGI